MHYFIILHPFLALPSLPTCLVWLKKVLLSPHTVSLWCASVLPYISGQFIALNHDPSFIEEVDTVFWWILKKTGKLFLNWEEG